MLDQHRCSSFNMKPMPHMDIVPTETVLNGVNSSVNIA